MENVLDETITSLVSFFSQTVSEDEDLSEIGDEHFHEGFFLNDETEFFSEVHPEKTAVENVVSHIGE